MSRSITIQIPEGPDKYAIIAYVVDRAFCRALEVIFDVKAGNDRRVIRDSFNREVAFWVKRMVMIKEEKG